MKNFTIFSLLAILVLLPATSSYAQGATWIDCTSSTSLVVACSITIAAAVLMDVLSDKDTVRDPSDEILFFEGNSCTQNLVGSAPLSAWSPWALNVEKGKNFDNDEARSMYIRATKPGTQIYLADRPDGRTHDDHIYITLKESSGFCVSTFEPPGAVPGIGKQHFHDDERAHIQYQYLNGLDGKVSYVRVTAP